MICAPKARHESMRATHFLIWSVGLLGTWAACAVMGCHPRHSTSDEDKDAAVDQDSGQSLRGQVSVEARLQYCGRPTLSVVGPRELLVHETATFSGHAEPMKDLSQSFHWSATSGRLSTPESSTTQYECDALGMQTLTMTVRGSDGCEDEIRAQVQCAKD
jgi:hypothetical protein